MSPRSFLAPAFTVLALITAAGLALDGRDPAGWAIGLTVVSVVPAALFLIQRTRGIDADWRLSAPTVLALVLLAAVFQGGIAISVLLLVAGAASYLRARTERSMGALAETAAATNWLLIAGLLSLPTAGFGQNWVTAAWLCISALWLLLWMPTSLRRVESRSAFHVSRPPEEVAAYLLDQRHLTDWYDGYLQSDLIDSQALGLGAIFQQVVRIGKQQLEATVTVTEYDPGHRICSSINAVPDHVTGCYTFSRDEGGTVAVYDFTSEQPYSGALMGNRLFLAKAMAKAQLQRQAAYAKLKSILEGPSAPAIIPRPDDQPDRPVVEEVVPRPVDEHEDPAPKADNVDQVDEQPHEPSEKPGQADTP